MISKNFSFPQISIFFNDFSQKSFTFIKRSSSHLSSSKWTDSSSKWTGSSSKWTSSSIYLENMGFNCSQRINLFQKMIFIRSMSKVVEKESLELMNEIVALINSNNRQTFIIE